MHISDLTVKIKCRVDLIRKLSWNEFNKQTYKCEVACYKVCSSTRENSERDELVRETKTKAIVTFLQS